VVDDPVSTSFLEEAGLRVEAARYALLRRLAPALRHEAVGHLQPIAMVTSVLERRLEMPAPDLEQLRDGVRRLAGSSRSGLQACLDVIGWLSGDGGEEVPLEQAVRETVGLLKGSLGFRGFTLREDLPGASHPVPRAAMRQVLPACLLWLTDHAGPPAQVTLGLGRAPGRGGPALLLSLEPTEGEAGSAPEPACRPLSLAEVQALAEAEGLRVHHEGDQLALELLPA
jgi:hypothetical protein